MFRGTTTTPPTAFRSLIFSAILCTASICNAEVVEFGACFQNTTNSYRCALNAKSCTPKYDEVFFAPFQLSNLPGRKPCTCEQVHIGNCSPAHGNRGQCGFEPSVCETGSTYTAQPRFYNDGATCMCHGMTGHQYSTRVIETEKALYGACQLGSDVRCAMLSGQCEDGETWKSPEVLSREGKRDCTCDRVRVGSCAGPGNVLCAADASSCGKVNDFLSAYVTKERGNDCFLCAGSVFDVTSSDTRDNSFVMSDASDDKANADDDDKEKADDDDKEKADDDDKASTDDDDKASTDDDDKASTDDDDKANADDDDKGSTDDRMTSMSMANSVTRVDYGFVFGFMILGVTSTVVLSAFLVYSNTGSRKEAHESKRADGSVV